MKNCIIIQEADGYTYWREFSVVRRNEMTEELQNILTVAKIANLGYTNRGTGRYSVGVSLDNENKFVEFL